MSGSEQLPFKRQERPESSPSGRSCFFYVPRSPTFFRKISRRSAWLLKRVSPAGATSGAIPHAAIGRVENHVAQGCDPPREGRTTPPARTGEFTLSLPGLQPD
jgi:hypothetical protein